MTLKGLEIVNNQGGMPTFHDTLGRPHWIDIILSTKSARGFVRSWHVLPDAIPSSDHNLLGTVVKVKTSIKTQHKLLNWKKVDWDSFNKSLRSHLWAVNAYAKVNSIIDVDKRISSLTEALHSVMREYVKPIKQLGFRKAWFTDTVKSSWRTFRKVRNRLRKARRKRIIRPLSLEAAERERVASVYMTRARFKFAKTVKDEKAASFKAFCGDVDSGSEMWEKFKRIRGGNKLPDVPSLVTQEGMTKSNKEKADALFAKSFPTRNTHSSQLMVNGCRMERRTPERKLLQCTYHLV